MQRLPHLFTKRAPWMAALLALGVSGCPSTPTWHQDVRPIIEGRCLACHRTGGIGRVSLESYAQTVALADAVAEDLADRHMPPWYAGNSDVQFLDDGSLTEAQVGTVLAWLDGGTPEGDPSKPGPIVPDVPRGLERVDRTLELPLDGASTEPRCFIVNWPGTSATFFSGFDLTGAPSQARHVALYFVPAADVAQLRTWESEDAAPGYACPGDASGGRTPAVSAALLALWLPGHQPRPYARVGLPLEPGGVWVAQLVMRTPGPGSTATLSVREESTATRAAVLPVLDPAWPQGGLVVPANAAEVVHQFAVPVSNIDWWTLPWPVTQGFAIEAVQMHLSPLGARAELNVQHADGTRTRVLDMKHFEPTFQLDYQLTEPFRVAPTDTLRLKCVFDNSPGRLGSTLPSRTTNWGFGDDEALCVGLLRVSP